MIPASRNLNLNTSLLAGCLLAIMLILMILSGWHKPLAYDETNNLQYGYQFLTLGPSAPPEGQRMPILALNALGCIPFQCDFEVLRNSNWARLTVLWPSMLFALLTGFFIFRWARQLFSCKAALLPLALFCLNPNYIAHGKELTSDLPTIFFVLASVYFFWKFCKETVLRNLFLSALMTGLAILSKFSSLILLPVLALLFFIQFYPEFKKHGNLLRIGGGILFFSAVIWFTVNAGYLFNGSFTPAQDYKWQSKRYQKWGDSPLPLPFPKIFMEGMDTTQYLEENPNIGRGNNYIFGKRRRRGRWYAFPSMIGLKTPLSFFILLAVTLTAFSRIQSKKFLLIPFAVWTVVFSLACSAQLGIRYVLPGLTFLFILTGHLFNQPLSILKKYLISALGAWYCISSLSYHPHYMSYFNEIIGSRINAYRYLADSNLDWEDKTYFLKKFQAKHPKLQVNIKPTAQSTGYIALGANDFTGVLDEREYEFLRNSFQPLQHITYSHYLFYIPPGAGSAPKAADA